MDAGAREIAEPRIAPERAALVVVGSSLEAETYDRPVAAALASTIDRELGRRDAGEGFRAAVCTDLWYLNQEALRTRPTISVGRPERNALSAYLGDKTPSAYVVDDVLIVQADPEMSEPVVCCWGVDAAATAWAVDAFVERYLDAFMDRLLAAG